MIRRLSAAYKRCKNSLLIRSKRTNQTDGTIIRRNGEQPYDARKSHNYGMKE